MFLDFLRCSFEMAEIKQKILLTGRKREKKILGTIKILFRKCKKVINKFISSKINNNNKNKLLSLAESIKLKWMLIQTLYLINDLLKHHFRISFKKNGFSNRINSFYLVKRKYCYIKFQIIILSLSQI